MRSRRQTIWLVSMLSIMVVLSGYYLFTEDVNEVDLAGDITADMNEGESTDITMDSSIISDEDSLEWLSENVVSEETTTSEEMVMETNEETTAKTDEEILIQLQEQDLGADYYTATKLQRTEEIGREIENLMAVIDTAENAEVVSKAYDDLQVVEDKGTKVDYIEEQLMQTYPEAVVTEENDRWKVEVQTSKIETSEAVSIIDLVVSQLEIKPGQVTVTVRQ
ncbi:SpoIIIAH-like family protein [Chengkuizengella axinellae]|uniref:SpoIIIAH-like family protein n=1 Tax=Chengkuizengella axinellae TaxID=3064388 RepID=A0ABT9J248_9BACL|nr:SpoIIIAH-like family protein [Chengkuizengella sp. 2205SS18-9]MDP5275667.1 SpoIIIAH-like family protein [Chengkuizengella sp. 2205SS18-9]